MSNKPKCNILTGAALGLLPRLCWVSWITPSGVRTVITTVIITVSIIGVLYVIDMLGRRS
ncbi:hypothetical protein [Candidatus Liberibacter brunswickensis]|uniref:hypothetical protein n=1 Tax=Candidatus Liberibacter brunswickensis TaxID=1968796 RepID=UPI002FE3B6E7